MSKKRKGLKTESASRETRPVAPKREPGELFDDVERRLAAHEPELEVLAVEIATVRGAPTVRIFLDSPQGVTLDTCARVTGHLGDLLREYSVEVSSPGSERPLKKPEHFRRFLGRRVRVRTFEKVAGRNDFKGELLDADEERIALAGAWGTISLAYEQIRRSNLLPEPGAGS